MSCCHKILLSLRVLAVVVALAAVGLGAWSKLIMHDIEIRGLELVQLEAPGDEQYWRSYFSAVLGGAIRIWVIIGAASLASILGIFILIASLSHCVRLSATILISIEALSMSAMATAFGTSLSLALDLDSFSISRFHTIDGTDLANFAMQISRSKGRVVATGVGWFLFLVAVIVAAVNAYTRARAHGSRSFEPTASALGMGLGDEAIAPMEVRSRVPSMYDPRQSLLVAQKGILDFVDDEEKGFAKEGGYKIRSDSVISNFSWKSTTPDQEILIHMNVEQPEMALQTRPARPWSEPRSPKRRDDVIHAS